MDGGAYYGAGEGGVRRRRVGAASASKKLAAIKRILGSRAAPKRRVARRPAVKRMARRPARQVLEVALR